MQLLDILCFQSTRTIAVEIRFTCTHLFFFFKTKGNQAYNQGKKINSADHIFLIIWYSQID